MKRLTRGLVSSFLLGLVIGVACSASHVLNGYYAILSKESGKAVIVDLSTVQQNGANVKQWEYKGNNHQYWKVEGVGGGHYKIINARSGLCLEVAGWDQGAYVADNDGANIRQWEYTGGANQLWRFESAGGGYYRIVSVRSGKCIDLYRYSHENGANIQQWACHGADNQLWELRPHGQTTGSSGPSFSDNLNSGGGHWNLANGWSVGSWQGDKCLVGTQHAFATMNAADHWTDYTLTSNVVLPNKGWLHINVHTDWSGPGRYYVGVSNHTVRLTREWPIGTHTELARSEILHLDECCSWNEVTLLVGKTRIRVYVNGVRYIDHTDMSKADGVLQDGGISFESQGTAVYVDDVRVVSGFHIPDLRCEVARLWIAGVEIPRANVDGVNDRAEWRLRFEGYVSKGSGVAAAAAQLQWSGAWSSDNVASGWHFPLNWVWDIDLDGANSYFLRIDGYEYDGGGNDPLLAAAIAFHASILAAPIYAGATGGLVPVDPITAATIAIFASLNDNDVLPTLTIDFDKDENFGLSWIPYASTAGAGYKFTYILKYEIKCKEWDCP